jgi:hypothetical protein
MSFTLFFHALPSASSNSLAERIFLMSTVESAGASSTLPHQLASLLRGDGCEVGRSPSLACCCCYTRQSERALETEGNVLRSMPTRTRRPLPMDEMVTPSTIDCQIRAYLGIKAAAALGRRRPAERS